MNELGRPDYVCEHVGREKEYVGRIYNMSQDNVDINFSLWTIQDARPGDTLIDEMNHGYIVKYLTEFDYFKAALKSNELGYNNFGYTQNGEYNGENMHPATKEQRDLLFQKMKEAGYEWDADKKELKKIEQKPQRTVSAETKEAMYSKPDWNEEDEENMTEILSALI